MMTANGLSIVGWRDVPVDESVLGVLSKDFVPTIRQVCYTLQSASILRKQLHRYNLTLALKSHCQVLHPDIQKIVVIVTHRANLLCHS